MALPKLNTSPKYETVIPSTGKTVRFRPYLVKEEKVLLMAFEQNDPIAAMKAIIDTIVVCVDGDLKHTELATFDVEYLFTQIRAKSVGEKSQINVKCTNCEHLNLNEVDLSTVSVDTVEPEETVVDLGDDIFVELKYPTAYDLISLQDPESSASETLVATIVASIDGIQTEKERIDASEVSKEELQEFVESMTGQQFKSVSEWVGKIPAMEKEIEFECKNCGTHNTQKLRGLVDFF